MKRELTEFFKKFGTKKKREGRRVTGRSASTPPQLRLVVTLALMALFAGVFLWGSYMLFHMYYFKSPKLFRLHCLHECVEITTGKNLTAEMICQILQLEPDRNLFEIPIDERRRDMMQRAAGIKEMTITRRLPDKLLITVIEREPVARIGTAGRVVDQDGVVFMLNVGTGGLPTLIGNDDLMKSTPGTQLRGYEMAGVRLAQELRQPGRKLNIVTIDMRKTDYLLLYNREQQSAKLSWDGMLYEADNNVPAMCRQLTELEKCMNSEAGRRCKSFNATVPNRISAVPLAATQS